MTRRSLNAVLVLLLIGFTAGSCGVDNIRPQGSDFKDTKIIRKGRYIYFATPFRDFVSSERAQTVLDAQEFLVSRLKKTMPQSEIAEVSAETLEENAEKVSSIVNNVDKWFLSKEDEIEEIGVSIPRLLTPSGFIVAVGAKKSFSTGVGAGASLSVGAVVVPTKVTRIDTITKKSSSYFSFRWAIVGLPAVQLGAGLGGDVTPAPVFRAGVGLIWEKLEDPKDFYGFAFGASGSIAAGFGNNLKIGFLKREDKSQTFGNPFAIMTYQTGGAVEVEWHAFGSRVMQLGAYLKALGLVSETLSIEEEDEEFDNYNSRRKKSREKKNEKDKDNFEDEFEDDSEGGFVD